MHEEKKMPKVSVAAIIVNAEGKMLLVKSPKWKNQWVVPGGHVEWGETLMDALKREISEETGLAIRDPELIRVEEFIFSHEYATDKHIIPVQFAVKTDDPESAVQLDGVEGVEYTWIRPEEVAAYLEVEEETKVTVSVYLTKQAEQKACEEYKLGWQRAAADYQNLQKEMSAKRGEWAEMSEQYILEEFIPVYDNFKKAFASWDNTNFADANDMNKKVLNWKQGIEYIMRQFKDVLKNHKVEEIMTVGEKFDPKFHETAGEEEVEGKEAGVIVREVDGGYVMNGRVVKVAKVIIAK